MQEQLEESLQVPTATRLFTWGATPTTVHCHYEYQSTTTRTTALSPDTPDLHSTVNLDLFHPSRGLTKIALNVNLLVLRRLPATAEPRFRRQTSAALARLDGNLNLGRLPIQRYGSQSQSCMPRDVVPMSRYACTNSAHYEFQCILVVDYTGHFRPVVRCQHHSITTWNGAPRSLEAAQFQVESGSCAAS